MIRRPPRSTLFPLHDALPILILRDAPQPARLPLAKVVLHAALATLAEQTPRFPPRAWHHGHVGEGDRKSTRLNSSHGYISYAVFCLKKKKKTSIPRLAQLMRL